MDRFLKVKLDTDYMGEKRRVRASWGGLTIGSLIDVELGGDSTTPKWVQCRIERWTSGYLLVSRASA